MCRTCVAHVGHVAACLTLHHSFALHSDIVNKLIKANWTALLLLRHRSVENGQSQSEISKLRSQYISSTRLCLGEISDLVGNEPANSA